MKQPIKPFCVRAGVFLLLGWITISEVGCSGETGVTRGQNGVSIVPLKFFDKHSAPMRRDDMPAEWQPLFGVIPGALAGSPRYPHVVQLGRAFGVRIDLNSFSSMLETEATTISKSALQSGLQVEPSDTKLARLATTIAIKPGYYRTLGIEFADSSPQRGLTLIYVDRPCHLQGTTSNLKGKMTVIDIKIDKAGLHWLGHVKDDVHDRMIESPAPPALLMAVVEGL